MKVKENIKIVYKLGDKSHGLHDETYETYDEACAAINAIVRKFLDFQIFVIKNNLDESLLEHSTCNGDGYYCDEFYDEDEIRQMAENEIRDFHYISEVKISNKI